MGVPPDKMRAIITWLTTFWEGIMTVNTYARRATIVHVRIRSRGV
jgi:hypothetical protein